MSNLFKQIQQASLISKQFDLDMTNPKHQALIEEKMNGTVKPSELQGEIPSFPDYDVVDKKVNAVPVSNPAKTVMKKKSVAKNNLVTVSGVNLRVRLSQGNNDLVSIISRDSDLFSKAGITGRFQVPTISLASLVLDKKVKDMLMKIGMSLKDGTKETRESDVVAIGDVDFKYKNCGKAKTWSISNVSNFKLQPAPVIAATKLASHLAPKPVSITPSAPTLSKLKKFSAVIPKDDPLLINDPFLIALGYTPSMNVSAVDHEDIRNRIAEILFNREYPALDWINKDSEKFGTFDFVEPNLNKTLDLKTICLDRNNLLIKRKAKEEGTLADAFSLLLVEDMGSTHRVYCYGFISRVNVLLYIANIPTCYMSQYDSFKIDKKILGRIEFNW